MATTIGAQQYVLQERGLGHSCPGQPWQSSQALHNQYNQGQCYIHPMKTMKTTESATWSTCCWIQGASVQTDTSNEKRMWYHSNWGITCGIYGQLCKLFSLYLDYHHCFAQTQDTGMGTTKQPISGTTRTFPVITRRLWEQFKHLIVLGSWTWGINGINNRGHVKGSRQWGGGSVMTMFAQSIIKCHGVGVIEPVKTQVGLLTETPETRSSLGRGTWPQLMCCALVAVWVPEVRRGRVGVSEQGGSSDIDQDSERWEGNKLKASGTRGIHPKQAGGCRTWWGDKEWV